MRAPALGVLSGLLGTLKASAGSGGWLRGGAGTSPWCLPLASPAQPPWACCGEPLPSRCVGGRSRLSCMAMVLKELPAVISSKFLVQISFLNTPAVSASYHQSPWSRKWDQIRKALLETSGLLEVPS